MLALVLITSASVATSADNTEVANEAPALASVVVKGMRDTPLVLPTDAVIDGPFGPGRRIQDVPRSVTPISADLMRAVGFNDLRDIIKLAPDTYSPTDFGAPSLPNLRGQLGEIFVDGIRQQGGNNGFGLPVSFNSVESINVVKGPAPVILGATQRVGGFLDLGLKRPDLNNAHGIAELSTGSWSRNQFQLDYSTPLTTGRSAVRASLEVRNEGSYFDYAHQRSENLYLAYRLKPSTSSTFDASIEYYHNDYTDIAGINRPTQALIDHGLYVTGQGVQRNGSTVPGANAIISPTGLVRLPFNRVLTDPDDTNSITTTIAHAQYRLAIDPNTSFISRSYFQHLERAEVAQNSFVEIIKGADTFEQRNELVLDRTTTLFGQSMRQQTDVGVDLRYNHVLGFSQFNTEADLPVDLTGPITNRRIPLTPAQKAQLVQLRPGVFVSPGGQYDRNGDGAGDYLLSDTTASNSYQLGLFLQHEIQINPQWSVIGGARGDAYYVTAKDPIAPSGVVAAHDSIHRFLKAFNASASYKSTDALTWYGALSQSESTSNSIAGGTVLGSGNRINPANFATRSQLYEAGVKIAQPGELWYADAALFRQTRSLRNRDGSNSGILARGIEMQWFYQDKHWFANAGMSYLDARYDNSASYQETAKVLDAFDGSRPDIIAGTGVGAPSFAAFPASTQRIQSLPSFQGSALIGYDFNKTTGATMSSRFTNAFALDYLATVKVRRQYTLDTAVYHRWNRASTELRLGVNNLTNQKNWAPVFVGGYFGATDVSPELPLNVKLSLRQSF